MDFNDFHFVIVLSCRDLRKSTSLKRYACASTRYDPYINLRPNSIFYNVDFFCVHVSSGLFRDLLLGFSEFVLVYEPAVKLSIFLEYTV